MAKITYSGTGTIYLAPVNADGTLETGKGFVAVGDAHPMSFQVTTETKKHVSREKERAGQTIASKTVINEIIGTLTLHQWNAANLAWALSGGYEAEAVTGDDVVAEEITAIPDEYVRLDYPGVSAVTVVRQAGDDAGAWASEATYEAGVYKIPTVPNNHFYKVTVGGTTHTSEPIWPTDGSTVTDGTVTWQDMGLITAVVDTDYEVQAALGMIKALATGSIEADEVLEVDYTYASQTKNQVNIGTDAMIRVAMLADLEDEYTGEDMSVELYSVVLNTTAEINFISEQDSDHEPLSFGMTLETPEGQTSPGKVNGVPL